MKVLSILLFLLPFAMGSKNYLIPNIKANWYKALEFCHNVGMDLVSVHSQQDHYELVNFIKGTDKYSDATTFWLGGSDLAEEDTWVWVSSGKLFTFTNWAEDEPSNAGKVEHCIEMLHNRRKNRIWTWNDTECDDKLYFICESRNQQCVESRNDETGIEPF